MNSNFSRIITLLRKERGISQKQAASDLDVSQALLSHYEKGIRECGLDFVIKVADYYDVSCDYLLGRSADRSGATISVNDIPDGESSETDNVFRGSILPILNKKLISNSLSIVFDILQKYGNKSLTTEISAYIMLSIYKMFRVLYSANPKNPQGLFSVPNLMHSGLASAAQSIAETNSKCIISGEKIPEINTLINPESISLSPEIISNQHPLTAPSLYNMIQNCESRISPKK